VYAIDYPLALGDVVFSPFRGGTVTFAGRNYSHKHYGVFVVIKADNGKYVSMSAHLNGLAAGIRKGARVTNSTVIGYAGNTGDPSIPVGPPHLHQAFYRYPKYNSDGSPYGGAGLQVVYHRYTGTAARKAGYSYSSGAYRYSLTKPNYNATCREGISCSEGYAISN
jgi:murein DD-endopeptidase MepM/ murein hydrolase activator NlpD